MTPDEKRLQEIEGRGKGATEGPWRHSNRGLTVEIDWTNGVGLQISHRRKWKDPEAKKKAFENAKQDLSFIAHARQDIPWLIAKVRELAEEEFKNGYHLGYEACQEGFSNDPGEGWEVEIEKRAKA